MKRTAFYDLHAGLGAKIVEFGGFEMPVFYTGIIEEHLAVRNSVGVFDVSHMGEFEVTGPDALALVQRIAVNDASKLQEGKAQYSAMCTGSGGIVDDLLVYRLRDRFMLVVNASNTSKDFEWINSNAGGLNAAVVDRSDDFSLLAIQGPASMKVVQSLTDADLPAIPYYSFVEGTVSGIPAIISRTGYTGEIGLELYFSSGPSAGRKMWDALMAAGKDFGIRPIGLGARDTLRLEMGFCLYGNDIDDSTNPLEAGLGWITKIDKGDFIGKKRLVEVKQAGLKRKLVGMVATEDKALPRHGYEIKIDGTQAGYVTSGTISPSLSKGIALGYVPAERSAPGTQVSIVARNREIPAQIVKLPFYSK